MPPQHYLVRTRMTCLAVCLLLTLLPLLTACATPPLLVPTTEEAPAATLDINGAGETGLPVTLQMTADNAHFCFEFDQNCWMEVQETLGATVFLEYVLVGKPGPSWTLFYVRPPRGLTEVFETQANAIQWVDGSQSLLSAGPAFPVSETLPISPTLVPEMSITMEDGIKLVNTAMGANPQVGYVLAGNTALLLVSDGNKQSPLYTLVILGSVQPDGSFDPPPPGTTIDISTYCSTCLKCAWYCWIGKLFN